MTSKYKVTLSLTGAYILDALVLQDIWESAKNFLDSDVTTEISFSDVHRIESDTLSDALEDSIIRAYVMTAVTLSGKNYRVEPARRFSLNARSETFLSPLWVEIEGRHEDCRGLGSRIEELLLAKRQWYSPLIPSGTASDVVVIVVALAAAFAIPLSAAYAILGNSRMMGIAAAIELSLTWPIIWLLHSARKFFFPQLIVSIGRSAEAGSRAKSARTFLFGGVLVALLVGVAGSLIANFLSR